MKTIKVTAISAFNDNYIWALETPENNQCVLVDPGQASVCIDYIKQHNLSLAAILITHHHYDHTDGISELLTFSTQQNTKQQNAKQNSLSKVAVYTPAMEDIKHSTQTVKEGDTIFIEALKLSLTVFDIPGHTRGHVAYYNENQAMLFCGDTLFSAGCGRLFEGTAEQMFNSLNKLKSLPNNTQIYCAHEYTLANLAFALTVEPNNNNTLAYYKKVQQLQEQQQSSIPTTLAREKQVNPFLRTNEPEICKNVALYIEKHAQQHLQQKINDEQSCFRQLRLWKDAF